MDAATTIATAFAARASQLATERVTAVAANAAKTQEAAVATLMEAIQESVAAYSSSGAATASAAVGATLNVQA